MAVSTSKFNYIDCDPELCIGCQICEYVCSYTKTGEYNTYHSRIRTVRVDEVLITAIACRTCENAPCVIACPQKALSQDPETGTIRLEANKCEEDGPQCVLWCPKEALALTTPEKRAQKSRKKLIKKEVIGPK